MSSGGKTTINPNKNTLTEKTKIENEAVELLKSLSLREGDTGVIPKPPPGKVGKPFNVATNMYAVKLPERKIYRYDMTITGTTPKNKVVEFTKKSEESMVIADRVNVCRTTWRVIFHNHPNFFGRNEYALLYDLQSTLYSLEALPMPDDTVNLSLDIGDINNEEEKAVFKGIRRIDILIKKAKSNVIDLGDLKTIHNPETGKRDRSILNIIELIINQIPMFSEAQFLTLRGSTAYVVDAARYGLQEAPLDEGQTKYLAAGIKRSGCYIEGWSEGQNAVGMLLETRRSPFHSCLNLLDYIRQHASLRRYYNDFIRGQSTDRDLGHITSVLRKIVFNVTHNRSRRIEVSGFHRSTCTTINPSIGCSLEEYFFKQGIKLVMPNCHAVLVKNKGQHIYYPPEMLVIADNQLVLEKQMEAREKAAMIKVAAVRPDVLKQESEAGAVAIKLRDSPYTEASGVKFSKDVMKVQARQLPAPVMEYSGGVSRLKNGEAAWDQLPYVRGAKIKNYSLYVIGTEGQMEPAICEADQKRLQQHLKTAAMKFGMDIGELADTRWIFDYEVDDVIAQNAEHGVELVYFVSPESIKTAHDSMKHAEHKFKTVVTQDIRENTVRKVIQRAGATLENLIAKTNLKLGGVNYSVRAGTAEVQEQLGRTLFIGISNSQPGSKTAVDKAQGKGAKKNEKPGVLGYCANICEDKDTFAGDFMYIDAYRLEIYNRLILLTKRCVTHFKENRGHAPESVVFYYSGVAEGQFDNILKLSVPLMKEGIRQANNDAEIPLCVISVQKANNLTLFPVEFPKPRPDSRDHQFNVPPGTVVDTKVVHPIYTQFFLVPHTAIKGSARAPRYTVLLNEPAFPLDTIEGFSHALCYEHQIVGRATALPTPLMVAEDYANRGRHVFLAAEYEDKKSQYRLPRRPNGDLDLEKLTEDLSYERCPELRKRRVNA